LTGLYPPLPVEPRLVQPLVRRGEFTRSGSHRTTEYLEKTSRPPRLHRPTLDHYIHGHGTNPRDVPSDRRPLPSTNVPTQPPAERPEPRGPPASPLDDEGGRRNLFAWKSCSRGPAIGGVPSLPLQTLVVDLVRRKVNAVLHRQLDPENYQ